MREYTSAEGYKIYVFENAIPKDVCEEWIPRFRKETANYVGSQPVISKEVFELLKKYVSIPFPVLAEPGWVSFVRLDQPIYVHYDQIYANETHKVAFYLNEVEHGGTDFASGDDWLTVEAHEGTVVIFDIRLKHRGQQYDGKKVKYIMGLRLIEDRKM